MAGLVDFVRNGGDLVIDARNARALSEEITGIKFGAQAKGCMSCLLATGATFEEQPYTYRVSRLNGATPILINEHGHPLVAMNQVGRGRVIVGTVDHWMTDRVTYRVPEIVNMEPPYLLLRGIRAVLERYFDSFSPVEFRPAGLGVTTCCYDGDRKRLLVGLINHDLFARWEGTLGVRIGQVIAVRDLWHGKTVAAQEPLQLEVPAGDVLVLDVRLR